MSTDTDLYERDFYAWTQNQAAALKAGNLGAVDVTHLVEELEDMGGSREGELVNRLGVLLAHLLKWQQQPERRGHSGQYTIEEQRRRIQRLLDKNPSLKAKLAGACIEAYGDAVLMAAREMDRDKRTLPAICPWSLEQVLDDAAGPIVAGHSFIY